MRGKLLWPVVAVLWSLVFLMGLALVVKQENSEKLAIPRDYEGIEVKGAPATKPALETPPPPALAGDRWHGASNGGRVGDVFFEACWARSFNVLGVRFGEGQSFGRMLVVKLKLVNTSATKIVRFGGWQGEGTLEDEHGNQYSATRFGSGFGGFISEDQFDETPADKEYSKGCDTSAMIMRNLSLHPGSSYITYLFYEKPASVSNEARLTLPAKALGGIGELRVRVSILTPAN